MMVYSFFVISFLMFMNLMGIVMFLISVGYRGVSFM